MSECFRLLLIQDSEEDAEVLVRELERSGLDFSHQRVDSESAIAAALESPWDVVISDFSMPLLDGHKAFELVRHRIPDVPFIFLSGATGKEGAIEAIRAGARDYVLKSRLDRMGLVLTRELADVANRRERQEFERALHQEVRRYQNIFEGTVVALAEVDFSGTKRILDAVRAESGPAALFEDEALLVRAAEQAQVRAVNSAAVRLMEVESAEQLVGPLAKVLRSEAMGAWIDVLRAIENDTGLRSKEARIESAKGTKLDVLIAFAAPNTPDDYQNLIFSFTDISDRSSLESQMRAAQRMEAVGRLAAGIAHDFNNVLTVIRSYSSFVLDALHREDPLREDIQVIQDASGRAEGLTRQLLAFSRRQIAELRVLNINRLVAEMDKLLRRLLGADIHFETRLSEELGLVEIDPSHVEQILMNLAVNARDAMPDGGKLTIETENVTLDEAYGDAKPVDIPPGDYVMVALSDDGTGMDEETRLRVFEPFYTTKAPGVGTGLGLSTVYGIVRQAGGFIWVYSEIGSGTTFKVYLPRKEGASESFEPGQTAPRPSLEGTETILLVEDEEHVRRAAERILTKAGYQVLSAPNGGEALLLCEGHAGPIQGIITDIVMPAMNGRQLVERLSAIRPGMKALYMSGYTSNAIVHRGVLDQGVAFLQKPFRAEALLTKLRAVLDAE